MELFPHNTKTSVQGQPSPFTPVLPPLWSAVPESAAEREQAAVAARFYALRDAQSRLAYFNQHRELLLGAALLLTVAFSLLGVHVPPGVITLQVVWVISAIGFFKLSGKFNSESRLHRFEFIYFLWELLIVTIIVHLCGGLGWLAIALPTFTILFANVTLPPAPGRVITLLAFASMCGLAAAEFHDLLNHHAIFGVDHTHEPGFLVATLLMAALLYYSIGFSSSQVARMLTSKAQALQAANSELRSTGAELLRHRNNLEELVSIRTRALESAYQELRAANEKLQRLNELKSQFLSNVSHELRTPLTSIRSFSEILLSYPDEKAETRTEFLEIIKNESDRLTRLINDVLDLAKIEAGRMDLRIESFDVAVLVRNATEAMMGMAEAKGLRLEMEIEPGLPTFAADYDRMMQVLTNLLNNCLKFTDQGSVRVGASRADEELLLFVSDTGPGIPKDEQLAIFEKFHQVGNGLTSKPQGSGLGLAICQEIVQRHGGEIWVDSKLGAGSTFYCRLPFTARPQAVAVEASDPTASGGHPKSALPLSTR